MRQASTPPRRRVYWIVLHLAIALAFARHLAATFADHDDMRATDFTVFYTGWKLVLSDPARTYAVEAQRKVQADILGERRRFQGGVMTFYYPPHVAVTLAPFAALGFEAAIRIWLLVQIAAAALLVRGLVRASGLTDRLDQLVLATAVLGFLPLLYTLQIGQLSIAMTLALLGFWRAFERGRELAAGLALLALSIKPQLLPVPLIVLAVTRRWRPAAWAALFGMPLLLLATWVFGPGVWRAYPGYVRELEGYVAGGSHDHMLNLRGVVTSLAGAGHDAGILKLCSVVFAAVSLAIYVLVRRRARAHGGRVDAVGFAAALALALPSNLHLHLQDALAWALPITLLVAALGTEAQTGRRFAVFVLCWPVVYVAAHAIELAGTPVPIAPFALAVALAVVAVRLTARPLPARPASATADR